MASPRLSLVVAACNNMGIGIEGRLPWRLKGDMAFFRKLTLKTEDPSKCNAVIMGRKTWDSIPAKFRPLQDRVNVVISRNLPLDCKLSDAGDVHVARGLDEALELLSNQKRAEQQRSAIENIFVIGGTSIYEMALNSQYFYRLYLTRVLKDFECDAFLPPVDYSHLQEVHLPDVPSELQEDNQIQYRYCIYEKASVNDSCKVVSSNGSLSTLPVYISVAVEENRGFGLNGTLPWSLRAEFEHFLSMVTYTVDPEKKVAFIKGRRTFEDTTPRELQHPKAINIVISKSLLPTSDNSLPEHAHKVVDSLEAALHEAQALFVAGQVEKVWILGGSSLFKEAIDNGIAQRIYMTNIKNSYDCDVFFPQFQDSFHEIKELRTDVTDEATGVNMSFCVYERN